MSNRSLNRIELIGHVAGVPYIPDAMPKLAAFSIVTHKRLSNGSERSDFHRCLAWHRLADLVESTIKVGDRVYVDGRMEYERVERDGVVLTEATVQVKELILLGEAQDA